MTQRQDIDRLIIGINYYDDNGETREYLENPARIALNISSAPLHLGELTVYVDGNKQIDDPSDSIEQARRRLVSVMELIGAAQTEVRQIRRKLRADGISFNGNHRLMMAEAADDWLSSQIDANSDFISEKHKELGFDG